MTCRCLLELNEKLWSGEDPCSFLAILFILLFKYLNSEGYRGKLTQMQGLQCSDRNSTWLCDLSIYVNVYE